MSNKNPTGTAHIAIAKALDLPVSAKHSIELARNLRYKSTTQAKKILDGVIRIKIPIPYKRFTKDLGHKHGIGAGRFPEKPAREFLKLINSVESNAQVKGLNISNLKITKLIANKASIPFSGGRQRQATKRTHLEIEVTEVAGKGENKKSGNKKEGSQKESKIENKAENKVEVKHTDVKHTQTDMKPTEVKHSEFKHPEVKHAEIKPSGVKHSEFKSSEVQPAAVKHSDVLHHDLNSVPAKSKEASGADLLRQAQARAAVLNNNEKVKSDVHKVENLFEELQKRGTLRK